MEARFAAVDWGTSSFRIWLVSDENAVLAERRSHEGMIHAANAGFEQVLDAHLAALGAGSELPVVICGMAGSRQGWQEARYLTVPAALSDIVDKAVQVEGQQRDIRILPGLAQRDEDRPDVMRGEETQLLGGLSDAPAEGLACLPGTHSKWVRFSNSRVTGFSSQMTGELFALLAKQSILRHAVGPGPDCSPTSDAYLDAVRKGYRRPAEMSRQLFSLRAGQLLFERSQPESYERLSGLLIGSEIASAGLEFGSLETVRLIASGKLSNLYQSAFSALDITIDVVDADRAVLTGLEIAASRFWPLPDQQARFGNLNA